MFCERRCFFDHLIINILAGDFGRSGTPAIPAAPDVDEGVADDGYGIGDEIARSRNPLGVVGTPL